MAIVLDIILACHGVVVLLTYSNHSAIVECGLFLVSFEILAMKKQNNPKTENRNDGGLAILAIGKWMMKEAALRRAAYLCITSLVMYNASMDRSDSFYVCSCREL